jgi:hypothetical protein
VNKRLIQGFARFGYVAKGVVYLLIGVFAVNSAMTGERPRGKEGAVRQIGAQPFGDALLVLIGVGLAGYALWCFVQAVYDSDHEGRGVKGLVLRVGHAGSGVIHGALAILAFQLAVGDVARGHTTRTWIGLVLQESFGQVLVVGVGIGIVIFGFAQMLQAITGSFERHLETARMSASGRTWSMRVARIGLAGYGVVASIIGVFLIKAALAFNPRKAKDIGGALRALQREPYGAWLLALVASGVVAYGLYMFICAKYRRIRTP